MNNKLIEEPKNSNELSTIAQVLLAFSLPSNIKKLLNTKVGKDSVTCINGIRFGSMFWVIFAHTALYSNGFVSNRSNAFIISEILLYTPLTNGTYSVDSFLFLSGFLVGYLFYKHNLGSKPKKMIVNAKLWVLVNIKRFLR